jgi:CO/xanthine dehydrogenase Mo-binding subunit
METGKVTVLNYRASSWAGRVINPALAKLQNDGNVIFGLGPAMMEEVLFDGGQVTNPNLSDYLIPSIRDLPLELVSTALEGDDSLDGKGDEIHGTGEMTLPPVAPAIAKAIEDAVGVRVKDLPITAGNVLRGLKEKE